MDDILKSVRAVLQITPLRWANLAQTISADLLNLKPTSEEWSAVRDGFAFPLF